MTTHQLFASWAQWFWPLLTNHLWQATLFALLVWAVVAGLCRQASARARYAMWWLALAKFLVPVPWLAWGVSQLGVAAPQSSGTVSELADASLVIWQVAEPAEGLTATKQHAELYCIVTLLWLLGTAALLLHWWWRYRTLTRSLLDSEPATDERILAVLEAARQHANVRAKFSLRVSAKVLEPIVWGVWRPRLVLPTGLAARLTDEELSIVLLHELFHVKQHDNLRAFLQMLVCCGLWFHPLVWWLDRKLLAERELLCDERVLQCGAAARHYAAALWKVVEHGLGWPVAGVSHVTGADLKRRIQVIFNTERQPLLSPWRRVLLGAAFCALLGVALTTAWLARGEVQAAQPLLTRTLGQDAQNAVTFAVPVENPESFPLAVTQAKLSIGEAKAMKTRGRLSGGQQVEVSQPSSQIRQVQLDAQLQNQGPQGLFKVALEVRNPALYGTDRFMVTSYLGDAASKTSVLAPQGVFSLQAPWAIENRMNGQEVMDHLHEFRLRLVGVQYEGEAKMRWVKEEPNSANGKIHMVLVNAGGKGSRDWQQLAPPPPPPPPPPRPTTEKRRQAPPPPPPPPPPPAERKTSTLPMDATTRPVILYRGSATYTQEAREHKTEGAVVLNLLFGADGKIDDVQVVRGLPDGLTEQAVVAAKKTRFQPATKDGEPISVRGNLTYYFSVK